MNGVQKCILNIYKEIKKICDRHDIPFYGIGGTCIGAIRHGGFIPWDDDMDIGIPIEEMDRFIEIAKKELPDYLKIYSPLEKSHFAHLIIKVIDERTAYIEEDFYKYPDTWSGVWVDIIPLCGVPENKICRTLFYTYLYKQMFLDLYIREDYMGSHLVLFQKLIKKYVLATKTTNHYMMKQLVFVNKFPFKDYNLFLETGFFGMKNLTSKTKWLDDCKEVKFEDTVIYVPGDYDSYLSHMFGDYMTPPPVENRIGHRGVIDLEKSYKEYLKNPKLLGGKR